MAELWINYKDENGESGRSRVEGDRFTIGRHSSCDLVISSSKLSREHLLIERSDDRFFITDQASSNGTELNERPLLDRTEIMNGDRADLGGGADLEFEFVWDNSGANAGDGLGSADQAAVQAATVTVDAPPQSANLPSNIAAGFPLWLLIGPLAAIFILVIVVGILYIFSGGTTTIAESPIRTSRTPRDPSDDSDDKPKQTGTPTSTISLPSETNEPLNSSTPPPANLSDTAKVEKSAASFLRRIARNDPTAFLTSEQSSKVNSRIKQLSGSPAVAANIESARRSAAQLKSLAASKNLKPQFLAAAAMAKLGNSRGDVLQTAQSMADVLDKLHTQIGDELSDDCLLMVAALDQGQRGDFMGLRNMLQDLTNKFPESPRAVRTVWFLQKQNKISSAEFDFAIEFLAIGVISQSPKDFGLNAEPLIL